MPILRALIKDAEGRRVALVPLERLGEDSERARRFARSRGHPTHPPTLREVTSGIGYGLLALPVLLAAALTPAYLAFNVGLPWWGKILAALPMALLPAAVTIWLVRRVAGERIARRYLQAGYCASCGYDLESTAAGAEGVRRCPECGASWADPIKDRS